MTDIPALIERLRAWKSLRACDFEENSPLAEDLEAAAQALQQKARDKAQLVEIAAIEMGKRDARIRELEAERDAAKGGRHILAHGVNELTIEIGQLRAERDKLRETLAGMHCPREINPITIADCTRRNQCRCSAGAVFVKTGDAER